MKNGGEVKHLLPSTRYEGPLGPYLVYGEREHTFDLFDSIINKDGSWQGEKIEWVEVIYGGNLKTPNEQGVFTKVDGGQKVKRWTRNLGVTLFWDPEPETAAPADIPEPDEVVLGDSNSFSVGSPLNFAVTSSEAANVTINGNLVVNGSIEVAPTVAVNTTEATPELIEELESEVVATLPVSLDAENVEAEVESPVDEEEATN